ncbi:GNAT family N-acetyltransferase [Polaromonas aquatica]|uniref:GNAT family N-acetyltransferase n=1 Tax=Polaromonas aquatica TaxID=332657 RepID=UPI003D654C88
MCKNRFASLLRSEPAVTDISLRLSLQPVAAGDFEDMLALRIEAMQPSLERVGRFDLARSRERLSAGFFPQYMQHILLDGERVGFFTLKPEGEAAVRLDHLYLRSSASGQGIGSWVLRQVLAQARERGLAVRLTALKESDANRFYLRHGFVLQGEEGVDLHYEWPAVERVA